jgi:GAF domain-containing protein
VGELPTLFKDHCLSLDLQLPSLPEFIETYASPETALGSPEKAAAPISDQEAQYNQYVAEIRQAVEAREPTSSIITSVMETLAFGLKFDRVLLLLMAPSKTKLMGRLGLGDTGAVDPKSIVRPLGAEASPSAADARAIKESRPVFIGDPILEGGWPFAVTPIGFGQRCVGIIYGDRVASQGELTQREQAAIGILAELLDRSISLHS